MQHALNFEQVVAPTIKTGSGFELQLNGFMSLNVVVNTIEPNLMDSILEVQFSRAGLPDYITLNELDIVRLSARDFVAVLNVLSKHDGITVSDIIYYLLKMVCHEDDAKRRVKMLMQ